MKRFIFILLLLFSSLVCYSQNKQQKYEPLYKTTFPSKTTGYGWQLVGPICTGCGAGYIGIERSAYPNEFGNYQYLIYLYTSSYNYNNQLTYTYFQKIKVYGWYNNQWVPLDNNLPFDLIVGNTNTLSYTLFSSIPNQYILITIGNISAY